MARTEGNMTVESCIFCKLGEKEIPTRAVYEDETTFAFHDMNPEAPVHVLVIPKAHIKNVAEANDSDSALLGHLLLVAKKVAKLTGIAEGGYRIVTNSGKDGGQSVDHLHLHVMGGRHMTWPPG